MLQLVFRDMGTTTPLTLLFGRNAFALMRMFRDSWRLAGRCNVKTKKSQFIKKQDCGCEAVFVNGWLRETPKLCAKHAEMAREAGKNFQ